MLPVSQYSLALLLVAAVASNGLTDAVPSGDYYSAMLTAVNNERAKQGVPTLCLNKKLTAAAQAHSDDMAKNNYMAHDGADGSTMSQRITEAGYEWDSVAENVAAGQEEVASVMESWMNSQGHRENILGADYTMFGTAFAYNKDSTYGIYWTQDFGAGSTEACDGGNTTTPATTAPTKQGAQPTPAPTTSVPETPTTAIPSTDVPATKAPVVTPAPTTSVPETPATTAPVVTPAPTTSVPETPATTAPVVTPAPTTSVPETPATTAPVATPAATTPAPVATPAATTPAPVSTPATTTTPPSTSQKDCESNF